MRWKTERTAEFEEWWRSLTRVERKEVLSAIETLEESGPILGRPLVDSVKGSNYPNLKELRPNRTVRIFFAFDPRRVAVLLLGGDKSGRTKRFYPQMIARADKIYEAHIRSLGKRASSDEKG